MAPPVDELTTRATPARRAASSTLIVPPTLTSASNAGSATARRTSICAARWKTTSGAAESTSAATRSPSRMSHSCSTAPAARASVRLDARPVERSSSTTTSSPRPTSASTRLDPMNPAPPVTKAFMECAILVPMRIWVDFTNTAHVIVLRPLVERLEAAGHDVALTARPLSHTVELLEEWGRPHLVVGRHGGVRRRDKALAAADRARILLRWAASQRFDRALAHGSTDVPVVSRVLRISNTTMFDYEWAATQHHVNCRLANRVLVPAAIPPARLARYGARGAKLIRYPGLKEEYYLADFEPDRGVLADLGAGDGEVLCIVRTAPSYALYLGGSETPLLARVLRRASARSGSTASWCPIAPSTVAAWWRSPTCSSPRAGR